MAKLNFVPGPQATETPTCAPFRQVMNEVQVGSAGSAMLVWALCEAHGSLVTVVVVVATVVVVVVIAVAAAAVVVVVVVVVVTVVVDVVVVVVVSNMFSKIVQKFQPTSSLYFDSN